MKQGRRPGGEGSPATLGIRLGLKETFRGGGRRVTEEFRGNSEDSLGPGAHLPEDV